MFSDNVKLSCISAAPDNWRAAMAGLSAVPTSATLTSRLTVTCPVSVSTSTSTPVPAAIQNGVICSDWPVS